MSSEKAAVRTLRKHTLEQCPGSHWQRLEDSISLGVPDISVAIVQQPPVITKDSSEAHRRWAEMQPKTPRLIGELWIEAKELDKLPVRNTTPVRVGLRQEQLLWLDTAKTAGRRVCVAVRTPDLWLFFNDHFQMLFDGAPWSMLVTKDFYHCGVNQLRANIRQIYWELLC